MVYKVLKVGDNAIETWFDRTFKNFIHQNVVLTLEKPARSKLNLCFFFITSGSIRLETNQKNTNKLELQMLHFGGK